MTRVLRVSIGVSNLSFKTFDVVRTGIPQVVFHILKEAIAYEDASVEFVPILRLPQANFTGLPDFLPLHFNASQLVLRETLKELGVSIADAVRRWPYLQYLFGRKDARTAYERACLEAIADTDLYFEVAASDVRNVVSGARRLHPDLKYGLCVHDMCPLKHPEYVENSTHSWFRNQYRECLRKADFSISVSRSTAMDVLEQELKGGIYYAGLPSPLVRRGPPLSKRLREAFPTLRPRMYLCSLATLEPRKNLEALIDGFERFCHLFPDDAETLQLVLVGVDGWKNRDLYSRILGLGNVFCPGFVSDEDLEVLLSNALCLVLPSHYEGFGLSVAQAREYGIPVICAANTSLPEASGLNAIFVRLWLEDELACCIRQVLRDSRAGMRSVGDDLFSTAKDWKEVLSRWVEVFQCVVLRK